MTLKEKTILITGASRGIGASIAAEVLINGGNVCGIFNKKPGRLQALQHQFGEEKICAFQADLTEPGVASSVWDHAVGRFGAIHGLVNNAAIMPQSNLCDSDQETWDFDWQNIWQVNVKAVADLTRLAVIAFKDQGGGRIVSVGSRAGYRGDNANCTHYAASKGAVAAFMKSIARAYAGDNIMAFTLAPGWVRTDMAAVAFKPGNEHMLDEIPLGRAAEPEEIARMTCFLLSGQCDSATGGVFDINGASYVR